MCSVIKSDEFKSDHDEDIWLPIHFTFADYM